MNKRLKSGKHVYILSEAACTQSQYWNCVQAGSDNMYENISTPHGQF
jgi:hypothetical protein